MRKQWETFLDDYFPLTTTGQGPLRPGQRAERLTPGAAAPPPQPRFAKPAPRSMPGRGPTAPPPRDVQGRFATTGVCPTHAAPACERCRAFNRGALTCCGAQHEGHNPARGLPRKRPGTCILAPTERREASDAMRSWLARTGQPPRGAAGRGADEVPRAKRERTLERAPAADPGSPPASRRCRRPPTLAGKRPRVAAATAGDDPDTEDETEFNAECSPPAPKRRREDRGEGPGEP